MAKPQRSYVCQACGAISPRWAGKCAACGEWNSLAEEAAAPPRAVGLAGAGKARAVTLESLKAETPDPPRFATGIAELDRVCGDGLVPGSALLVGGDPGIGKSTLLLQAAARVAQAGGRVVYLSGEEGAAQVRLRAQRLGVADAPVALGAETSLSSIVATLGRGAAADLVIVDSIQTLWSDEIESAPGTVSQVRSCAASLVRLAKQTGSSIVLVGHVTKDGQIAGPKVVEHMVDTVLYFEGDRSHQFRILRAVKNRFGPTDEIGVFEMRGDGLREVANPSELFLGERGGDTPGAAVFAGMEGTRPVLVEIQALVAPSTFGTPRRATVGFDQGRLSMLLAVLEARCGVSMGGHDVYLNVAGGYRISEPAADLAAAAALVSALSGTPQPQGAIFFGEVSLSGAIRGVGQPAARLKEAARLGFTSASAPVASDLDGGPAGISVARLGHLSELVSRLS
jgi:DNA repair protein RadA/Sms